MHAAARSLIASDLGRRPAQRSRSFNTVSVPEIEFQLIASRADFDALENDWNDLFSRTDKPTNVFQTFNFCWHWANHYLGSSPDGTPNIELSIVTGRREGRLVLLWPLVQQRVRGVTQTFWMGAPVAQYGDILVDAAHDDARAVMGAAFAFLRANSTADLLRLRRVRADATVAPLMTDIGARIADRLVAPFMDLASAKSFAEFEQRYSGKARKNRRRLARRLEEKGPVEFVRYHGGADARALAIEAVELKAHWLQSRGLVSTAIADERMSRLFADLAEGGSKPTGCIVSALKSAGETAALEVSFVCKSRLAMHLIAFNLAHEKSGAGVLLLEQSLKDGYKEGLSLYDMLAPGDVYKFDWCDKSDDVIDWVKPLTLKGTLYARVYLEFLRTRLKTWLKGLPEPLLRLIPAGRKTAKPDAAEAQSI